SQVTELAARGPEGMAVSGMTEAKALKQAGAIPTLFVTLADPVGNGLVSTLKSSGGNITGFTAFEFKTAGKWLELLAEIAPGVKRAAFVFGGAEVGSTGGGFYCVVARGGAARGDQ